jgi:hypothetical protein
LAQALAAHPGCLIGHLHRPARQSTESVHWGRAKPKLLVVS